MNSYMKEIVDKTTNSKEEINDLNYIFNQTINLLNKAKLENIFWWEKGGF